MALSFSRNAGIAIIRRRIGGGALGPDRDQLIFTYAANTVDRRPEPS